MRRRSKLSIRGVDAEKHVLEFFPDAWKGATDFAKYEAWDAARVAWADEHLPGGVMDLPLYTGWIPDEPFDPYSV